MTAYLSYSDRELTGLLKSGDHAAFEEIYTRYRHLLFLYAYKKLKDREEAKDVVQNVFIWLWNNRENFTAQATLSGYLYKSVLNRVFDIFKHQDIIGKYLASNAYSIDVDSAETDYLIREKDIAALIEREIAALPTKMRAVYQLRHQEQLTNREIAERLDMTEYAVSGQLKRALKQLRLRLGLYVYLIGIIFLT